MFLCHRRECEFEDDCDSLAWEETEETLLLWEDSSGYTFSVENQGEVRLSFIDYSSSDGLWKLNWHDEFMYKMDPVKPEKNKHAFILQNIQSYPYKIEVYITFIY